MASFPPSGSDAAWPEASDAAWPTASQGAAPAPPPVDSEAWPVDSDAAFHPVEAAAGGGGGGGEQLAEDAPWPSASVASFKPSEVRLDLSIRDKFGNAQGPTHQLEEEPPDDEPWPTSSAATIPGAQIRASPHPIGATTLVKQTIPRGGVGHDHLQAPPDEPGARSKSPAAAGRPPAQLPVGVPRSREVQPEQPTARLRSPSPVRGLRSPSPVPGGGVEGWSPARGAPQSNQAWPSERPLRRSASGREFTAGRSSSRELAGRSSSRDRQRYQKECNRGCGRLAAPGFRTCCRGCAMGKGHDSTCRPPARASTGLGLLCSCGFDNNGRPGGRAQEVRLKSSVDDLDGSTRSGDAPHYDTRSDDVLFGFIDDQAHAALKRLHAKLDSLGELGLTQDEAIDRGMIPGLGLVRFEDSARKLHALGELGVNFQQGVEMGLVQQEDVELYEKIQAQFQTLDTLGVTYEEGVQMGYIQDGVRSSDHLGPLGLAGQPGGGGGAGSGSPSMHALAHARGTSTPSLPSRQDSATFDSQHHQHKTAADQPEQQGCCRIQVGPGGISCSCGGPPQHVDEHEIA